MTQTFGNLLSRETIRRALKRLGFSWKKSKKLFCKASPKARQEYLEKLGVLLEQAKQGERLLVYLDEAHLSQEGERGYGLRPTGEPYYLSSNSVGRWSKVTYYGLYLYNEGQVRLWPYYKADWVNTIDVLTRLRKEYPERPMSVVWDQATYHRAKRVKEVAQSLGIELCLLSSYSPDFQPVEALWKWVREEVTYQYTHPSLQVLMTRVNAFERRINQGPEEIADRLWVKTSLDPEEEKLRISK